MVAEGREARRAYITTVARKRLHQQSFRERVLRAYRERCSLCRLGHSELLEAAHIVPDREPEGVPEVSNGISLCKLHHAAFDSFLLAITPEYRVEIRRDLLEETDGPMLQHGLKEMHERSIILPTERTSWPDPDALDARYQRFKRAS
jgi:putative restriction endonuclease